MLQNGKNQIFEFDSTLDIPTFFYRHFVFFELCIGKNKQKELKDRRYVQNKKK
jgi:hypothetical protein